MKKLVLFLCLCLLLLCSASVVFGRGQLFDQDAFETYIGKSKSVVRVISPDYQESADGKSFLVSSMSRGKTGWMNLVVDFNENDVVEYVNLQIDPETVKNDYDGDLYKVFSFGISQMGIDVADLVNIEEYGENEVDVLRGLFRGPIVCVCVNAETVYGVSCAIGKTEKEGIDEKSND